METKNNNTIEMSNIINSVFAGLYGGVDVVAIDESIGLYRDTLHNILLKQENGKTSAMGVLKEPYTNVLNFRPLNDKEKLFCKNNDILFNESPEETKEETKESSEDNNNIECQVFIPECGHTIHYDCAFESLQGNTGRAFYRYSNKGKLYFERLGKYTCIICGQESIIYDKELIDDPKTIEIIKGSTLVKIILAKNFFHSSYEEIWIQKSSELLDFKMRVQDLRSDSCVSPIAIIDELFDVLKNDKNRKPSKFYLFPKGLVRELQFKSKDVKHITLDEFYRMMYNRSSK